eukprot:Rmarinus@m.1106
MWMYMLGLLLLTTSPSSLARDDAVQLQADESVCTGNGVVAQYFFGDLLVCADGSDIVRSILSIGGIDVPESETCDLQVGILPDFVLEDILQDILGESQATDLSQPDENLPSSLREASKPETVMGGLNFNGFPEATFEEPEAAAIPTDVVSVPRTEDPASDVDDGERTFDSGLAPGLLETDPLWQPSSSTVEPNMNPILRTNFVSEPSELGPSNAEPRTNTFQPFKSLAPTLSAGEENALPVAGGAGWGLLMHGWDAPIAFNLVDYPAEEITVMMWAQGLHIHTSHKYFTYYHDTDPEAAGIYTEVVLALLRTDTSLLVRGTKHKILLTSNPGEWSHVAYTWKNDGTTRLYVNGSLEYDFQMSTAPIPTGGHFGVGITFNGENGDHDVRVSYVGLFDEIRTYRREMSLEEIRREAFRGLGRAIDDIYLWYGMDEQGGKGDHVISSGGRDYPLELLGADLSDDFIPYRVMQQLSVYWTWDRIEEGLGPTWVASTAPVVGTGPLVRSLPLQSELTITLTAVDDDFDVLTMFIKSLPENGTLYQVDPATGQRMAPIIAPLPVRVMHPAGIVLYAHSGTDMDPHDFADLADAGSHAKIGVHANDNACLDRFGYFAYDGRNESNVAEVILVKNHPPLASNLTVDIPEDADLHITAPAWDQDGDALHIQITRVLGRGTVYEPACPYQLFGPNEIPTKDVFLKHSQDPSEMRLEWLYGDPVENLPHIINVTGQQFLFSPEVDDYGDNYVQIGFVALDAFNQTSDEAFIIINVRELNDAPEVAPVEVTMLEDEVLEIHLNATDVDGPNDPEFIIDRLVSAAWLNVTIVSVDPEGVTEILEREYEEDLIMQYASGAVAYGSSQIRDHNVVGEPVCYPSYGPCDFSVCVDQGYLEIDVSFNIPVYASRVVIYEVSVPGALTSVDVCYLKSCGLFDERVYEAEPTPVMEYHYLDTPRALTVPFCRTEFPTNTLAMVFSTNDQFANRYRSCFDAVTLVGSIVKSPNRIPARTLRFTPDPDVNGNFTFLYSASDCHDTGSSQTFSIIVKPVNDLPVFRNETVRYGPALTTLFNVAADDVDNLDSELLYTLVAIEGELGYFMSAGENITEDRLPFNLTTTEMSYISDQNDDCLSQVTLRFTVMDMDAIPVAGHIILLCKETVRTVYIQALLPLTDGTSTEMNVIQLDVLGAIRMAVDEVNDKTDGVLDDVLPRTFVELFVYDTRGNKDVITDMTYTCGCGLPSDVILGTGKAETTMEIAESKSMLIMEYGARESFLSNEEEYPHFFRAAPADTMEASALSDIITDKRDTFLYGFGRLATLYTVDTELDHSVFRDVTYGGDSDIVDAGQHLVSTDVQDLDRAKKEIDRTGAKVFVVFAPSNVIGAVFDYFDAAGYVGANNYTWFSAHQFQSYAQNNLPGAGVFFTAMCSGSSSSFEERWQAQNYSCSDTDSCSHSLWRWPSAEPGSTCDSYCSEECDLVADCALPDSTAHPSTQAYYAYDAINAIMLAMDRHLTPSTYSIEFSDIEEQLDSLVMSGVTGTLDFSMSRDRASDLCYHVFGTNWVPPGWSPDNPSGYRPVNWVGTWMGSPLTDDASEFYICERSSYYVCGNVSYATADGSKPDEFCSDHDKYMDEDSGACRQCESDLFSIQPGMTFCTVCGYEDCPQEDCRPGFYYDTSLEQCLRCATGTYTDTAGLLECKQCPRGYYQSSEGQNFCSQCDDTSYADTVGSAACKPCPQNSLSVNFRVNISDCECQIGFYRSPLTESEGYSPGYFGHDCQPCPEGATCAGKTDIPRSESRYWGDPLYPTEFFPCQHPERCLSNFRCKNGTTGVLCNECESDWSEVGTRCIECPDSIVNRTLLTLSGMTLVLLFWVAINQTFANRFDAADIFLLFIQVTSIIGGFSLQWDSRITGFFSFIRVLNFDVDFFSPGCVVSWSDARSIYIQLVLPLLYFLYLIFAYYGWSLFHRKLRRPHFYMVPKFWREWLGLMNLVYHTATIKVLHVYFCMDLADNETRLLRFGTDVQCGTLEHRRLLAVGTIGLFLYTIGLPVTFVMIMSYGIRKNLLVSPWFHESFSFLYGRYKSNYACWHLILIARRLVFALLLIIFHGHGELQAMFAMFFIAFSYGITLKYDPYLNPRMQELEALLLGYLIVFLGLGLLEDKYEWIATPLLIVVIMALTQGFAYCMYAVFLDLSVHKTAKQMAAFKSKSRCQRWYDYLFRSNGYPRRTCKTFSDQIELQVPSDQDGNSCPLDKFDNGGPNRTNALEGSDDQRRNWARNGSANAWVHHTASATASSSARLRSDQELEWTDVKQALSSGLFRFTALSRWLAMERSRMRRKRSDSNGSDVKEPFWYRIRHPVEMLSAKRNEAASLAGEPHVKSALDLRSLVTVYHKLEKICGFDGILSPYRFDPITEFYHASVPMSGPAPTLEWLLVAPPRLRAAYGEILQSQLSFFLRCRSNLPAATDNMSWLSAFAAHTRPALLYFLLNATNSDVQDMRRMLHLLLPKDVAQLTLDSSAISSLEGNNFMSASLSDSRARRLSLGHPSGHREARIQSESSTLPNSYTLLTPNHGTAVESASHSAKSKDDAAATRVGSVNEGRGSKHLSDTILCLEEYAHPNLPPHTRDHQVVSPLSSPMRVHINQLHVGVRAPRFPQYPLASTDCGTGNGNGEYPRQHSTVSGHKSDGRAPVGATQLILCKPNVRGRVPDSDSNNNDATRVYEIVL